MVIVLWCTRHSASSKLLAVEYELNYLPKTPPTECMKIQHAIFHHAHLACPCPKQKQNNRHPLDSNPWKERLDNILSE
jgi:hypothetical protein